MKKALRTTISVTSLALLLSGCGGITLPSFGSSPSAGTGEHFVYEGHDFGPSRNEEYKKGVIDGCKTAAGIYTKSHKDFQSSEHYRTGWENGRLQCGKSASSKS